MTRFVAALVALAALAMGPSAAVEADASVSQPTFVVNVRGVPMSCTSFAGEPVAIILNEQLGDVGMASRSAWGVPVIEINPRVTDRHSDIVAQWWFAHECAHHALHPLMNNETNADCFAVDQLVALGLLDTFDELASFRRELSHLPGSAHGHLPGPARVANIAMCALY